MLSRLLSVFLILFSSAVFAAPTTYYVRPDGGTSAQCDGKSNLALAGSSAGHCAWSHPFYALPPNLDGGDPSKAAPMVGGDTLIIANGTYQMGLPFGQGVWESCKLYPAWPYDCHMRPVPSGTAAQPTQILGANYANCANGTGAPKLSGAGGAGSVLNLTGSSYVRVQCLEITDGSNCVQNYPTTDIQCQNNGTWAANGIVDTDGRNSSFASNNVTIQDVNVHGMAKYGVLMGNFSNLTVNHVKVIANGFGGWSTDLQPAQSISSGNNNFTNVEIAWNGCTENYPGTAIYGCWTQEKGGYGDGFGAASANAAWKSQGDKGNWLFQDVSVHDNMQDGLDFLHADPSATILFDRVNAYNNLGNQLKGSGGITIQNSVVNSHCSADVGMGLVYGNNSNGGDTSGDVCRAGGDAVVLSMTTNHTSTLQYSTVISEGNCVITVPDESQGDATSKLVVSNNVLIGMPVWITQNVDPKKSCLWYWQSPTSNQPAMSSNVITNVNGTVTAGNIAADPKLTNESLEAFDPTPLPGSPVIGKGTKTAIASDFKGNPRPSPAGYDIGAIQTASSITPPPTINCTGGVISNSACYCPVNTTVGSKGCGALPVIPPACIPKVVYVMNANGHLDVSAACQ